MAVRMELSRILIRELNDYQLIELREVEAEATAEGEAPQDENGRPRTRSFPIVIGLPEAQAIERRLKGIPIKRPQTHDLLANVVTALGGKLESITINDLSDHTFFATLDIRREGGKMVHVDSRPSDAIALGVAQGVPIYVAEHVLDAAVNDEV
ncbi:MAG: bifunctional nuclease family protein [Phycisphaerales bacterium]|nr:bifunctional nuclease family protein [Phycisphaerales bacterium]